MGGSNKSVYVSLILHSQPMCASESFHVMLLRLVGEYSRALCVQVFCVWFDCFWCVGVWWVSKERLRFGMFVVV